MTVKRIAYSSGEPAGIGPDIAVSLAQQEWPCELVVLGDKQVLQDRAQMLGLDVSIVAYEPRRAAKQWPAGTLLLAQHNVAAAVTCGQLDAANSRYVVELLEHAGAGCSSGEFAAVMTGPVHKGIINEAGIPFSGHTEFFAELSGTDQVVMMLATPGLRVALVTTHLPLNKVAESIQQPLVERVVQIVHHDLQSKFACHQPKILVCGLNPHAGEQGHLGSEEIEHIEPALKNLQSQGLNVSGPWPADTVFQPHYLDDADAVVAMYHDQGLPVLKYRGFGNAVNITLGLPFIRTSVDHGTALDKAGSGDISIGSAEYALQTAINMAQQQQN